MEYNLDNVEAGRIGDLIPGYHIRFPPVETERLKALAAKLGAARFKGRLVPGWWERTCLARWALDSLTGQPRTDDPLAAVPIGGKRLELRTRRHRELEEYHARGEGLYVGYPTRRLRRVLPDVIVVAASVITNDEGSDHESSSVYLFGALTHRVVYEACERQPVLPASSPGWGRLQEGPPLKEYDADLFRQLLGDTCSAAGDAP